MEKEAYFLFLFTQMDSLFEKQRDRQKVSCPLPAMAGTGSRPEPGTKNATQVSQNGRNPTT